jgi:hypothetical protein
MRGANLRTLACRVRQRAGPWLLLLTAGCAPVSAPGGWLPPAHPDRVDTYGGWIVVQQVGKRGTPRIGGELIAVSSDSVFVFTARGLQGVARSEIKGADLYGYEGGANALVVWTLLGTLASVSHGLGAMFSAPAWIVIGTIAASVQSWKPHVGLRGDDWRAFVPYCRYPQGLPPGLDRAALQPRRPSEAELKQPPREW